MTRSSLSFCAVRCAPIWCCAAMGFCAATGAFAQTAPLFIETDGIVVMEVESHPPVGGWEASTEHEGFTGSHYVVAKGGGLMTFPIYITRPGRYTMQIHNRHDHPRTDLENDAFVRMDAGPFIKCFSSKAHEWVWGGSLEYSHDHKVRAEYDLSAGLHKLQIRQRSGNFKIDRFALYLSEGDYGKKAKDLKHPETRGVPPMPELGSVPSAASAWSAGQLGRALDALKAVAEPAEGGEAVDAEARAQAEAALEKLSAAIEARRASFEKTKALDPLAAADAMNMYAKAFLSGSDLGKQFTEWARAWKAEPAAQEERAARRILNVIEGQADKIRGRGKITDEKFAKRHARQLDAIRQGLDMLREKYPNAYATKRAAQIAADYGIGL